MLKQRLAAANKVAADLAEAEAALDHAIAKIGALVVSLPGAQAAAKLSPVVGNTAYGHLQGSLAKIYAGRTSLVALHHELDEIRNRVGLRNFRIVATGDAVKILEPKGRNDDGAALADTRVA